MAGRNIAMVLAEIDASRSQTEMQLAEVQKLSIETGRLVAKTLRFVVEETEIRREGTKIQQEALWLAALMLAVAFFAGAGAGLLAIRLAAV